MYYVFIATFFIIISYAAADSGRMGVVISSPGDACADGIRSSVGGSSRRRRCRMQLSSGKRAPSAAYNVRGVCAARPPHTHRRTVFTHRTTRRLAPRVAARAHTHNRVLTRFSWITTTTTFLPVRRRSAGGRCERCTQTPSHAHRLCVCVCVSYFCVFYFIHHDAACVRYTHTYTHETTVVRTARLLRRFFFLTPITFYFSAILRRLGLLFLTRLPVVRECFSISTKSRSSETFARSTIDCSCSCMQ